MLNKSLRILLVFTAAICLSSTTVFAAGPPDHVTSTVDDCLVMCPYGDISFQVIVRDAAGNPCPGVPVAIDFCPCPEATLCLYAGGELCGNGKFDYLDSTTDASGVALFYPAGGGICGGTMVDIIAGGVVLAQRYVMALDLDGSFTLEESDFPSFDVQWRDFNCDGWSDFIDLTMFSNHAGNMHTCDAPVGEQMRTWGGIKSLWR